METAVTCSYLARTTCLVFNFASAFIFLFFLLVLGRNNVIWKDFISLLVFGDAFLFPEAAAFTVSEAFFVTFSVSF